MLKNANAIDRANTSETLWQLRVDLAAAHRIAAMQGFTESIYNHFTAVSDETKDGFLVLPFGLHWSEATASTLLEVSYDGKVRKGDGECERSAFNIHAPVHQARPDAVAVFHTHMPFTTALTHLEDMRIHPTGQTAASMIPEIAYDTDYQGYAKSPDEGRRLAAVLGDKNILLMANHGVIVVGKSIAEAYDRLYNLERAAQVQLYAMWTGADLRNIPQAILERTQTQFGGVRKYGDKTDVELHFDALKRLLKGPAKRDFDE
jgi:ribulose-5-phosphate 4-epimerase/fuculose-1-phosphate aldolase